MTYEDSCALTQVQASQLETTSLFLQLEQFSLARLGNGQMDHFQINHYIHLSEMRNDIAPV